MNAPSTVTLLLLLAVAAVPAAPASTPHETGAARSSVPLAIIRYDPNGKLASLPVRVNGSKPLAFTLDSGARHTVVDSATAVRLGLKIQSEDHAGGAGAGTVWQGHGPSLDVSVGPAHVTVPDPWIIALDKTGTALRMDGLLGEDFLARYVVRIDPVLRTFAVFEPDSFRYSGGGTAIPLAVVENRLFVDVELSLSNGIREIHRLRVDTGSEDAAGDTLVRHSPERRKSRQGVGLGQPYVDDSGVFESVKIGPYVIRHSWGAAAQPPSVGMEILRRFTLTFDVPHGLLHLEPNAHLADAVPAPE